MFTVQLLNNIILLMKKNIWKGKYGPLLIAEIGGNHEVNFSYAKKFVLKAIKSGVDVVKLQIYDGQSLVSKIESKKRFNHFRKFELTKDQHIYLAKLCKKYNVGYSASVWNTNAISWINKYLQFYKIGSGDLTAYPIIESIAKTGKPIVLSTGMSTLNEIKETLNFIVKINSNYRNKKKISVLQCTSLYPTLDKEVNLNVIKNLKKNLKITVGYSHHNKGAIALIAAYILGAEILEFHFTDDRKGKVFRDHKISLNPKETVELIQNISKINNILGISKKLPTKREISSKHIKTFRRSVYAKKFIQKGKKISENDLIVLRPNNGLDSRKFYNLIGKKIKRNTRPFEKIKL